MRGSSTPHDVPAGVPPSFLALATLIGLAVVSPWVFGGVEPGARRVMSTVALGAAGATLLLYATRGGAPRPALPLLPLASIVALVGLQLVPLPRIVHRLIAPGSCEVWHPAEPFAAAVMGGGPRPISLDPHTTSASLAWLVGLLALSVSASAEIAARRGTWRAIGIVAANGLALAIFGIWARGHFGVRLYGRYEVPTIAPFGPFVSKNHFAGYVVMAALLTLGLLFGLTDRRDAAGRTWSTGWRAAGVVFALVAALGMALSVLVSGSRGGAAALVGGLLAFALLTFAASTSWRRLAAPAAVFALLALIVAMALPTDARQRLRSAAGTSFRLSVWRDAVGLAAISPVVGSGLGSFHDAVPRVKQDNGALRLEHAENEYLEWLAETGIVGFAAAAGALGLLFARTWTSLRRCPPITRGIACGALAGLAALAVHSLVDFNLRVPSNAALAALLAAAAGAASGLHPRPLSPRVSAATGAFVLALAAAVLLGPAPSASVARRRVAEAARPAEPEVRALRLERAEASLRDVLSARPADAETWLQLAAVRAARGDATSARALAVYAVSLDPRRAPLRDQAEALVRAVAP